jgi:hypothetical protein
VVWEDCFVVQVQKAGWETWVTVQLDEGEAAHQQFQAALHSSVMTMTACVPLEGNGEALAERGLERERWSVGGCTALEAWVWT